MATYGYTFQSGDGVTPTRLNDARTISAIVNADISDDTITNAKIKSDAAIAFSKLAALDSANILVGNGSNVATKVAVTGDVTISNAGVTTLARPFTLRTAQSSTSGTSIDFLDIPSWAKRITVMFSGVSTNGTSNVAIRLGTSSGFVETGYLGAGSNLAAPSFGNNSTAFRVSTINSASWVVHGNAVLAKLSDNVWTISGVVGRSDVAEISLFAGSVDVGGVVDRLRVTTLTGTNTFDAGTINISYEG